MRKRWLLLALIAGTATAMAVLTWPARPLWRTSTGFTGFPRLECGQFTADGSTFVLVRREVDPSRPDAFVVQRYDTRTGAASSSVRLAIQSPAQLHLTDDTQRLLVVHNLRSEEQSRTGIHVVTTVRLSLLDSTTGNILSGFDHTHWHRTSEQPRLAADGRWLALENHEHWQVFDTATGLIAFEMLPKQEKNLPRDVIFRPDGDAMALLWSDLRDGNQIAVVSLVDGSEHWFDSSPPPIRQQLIGWLGRKLLVGESGQPFPPDAGAKRLIIYDFETGERSLYDLFGKESDQRNNIRQPANTTTLEHNHIGELAPWQVGINQFALKVGRDSVIATPAYTRYIDLPTGREIGRRPAQINSVLFKQLSPDGQRLVVFSEIGELAMWRLEQPRDLWALLAGVGAALPVLLVGRWRAKR